MVTHGTLSKFHQKRQKTIFKTLAKAFKIEKRGKFILIFCCNHLFIQAFTRKYYVQAKIHA